MENQTLLDNVPIGIAGNLDILRFRVCIEDILEIIFGRHYIVNTLSNIMA
jgi:hypothetical protein